MKLSATNNNNNNNNFLPDLEGFPALDDGLPAKCTQKSLQLAFPSFKVNTDT